MKNRFICLVLSYVLIAHNTDAQMAGEMQSYLTNIVDAFENDFATLDREVLASAQPDECFFGIGNPNNTFVPAGVTCDQCPPGSQAKVNQAYVWGLAKTGKDIWFGTGPNVHCLVIGGFLGSTSPSQTDSYVCEFGDSKFAEFFPGTVGDQLGDFRPPRMYRYRLTDKSIQDITPADVKVNQTLGIRSAGAHNGVTFFAGPGVSGVNMFAFDSDTGAYLGSQSFASYSNIRKWLVHDNILYTAVGNTGSGGSVLKWTGSKSNPFQFEVVGTLDGQGAELASHDGRIFVSTWPGGIGAMSSAGTVVASLYMSPPISSGGLTGADAGGWLKKWDVKDYEVDPVTAATYGGGALASFEGKLYWGTMHVPFLSTVAHFGFYGVPSTPDSLIASVLGTFRSISIFRGADMTSATPDIELLYGSPILPAYHPVAGWQLVPNAKSQSPLYGLPGFGNPFNNYTWTMGVYDNQLYVGTMDFSYLLFGELDISLPMMLPFSCDDLGLNEEDCAMVEKGYMFFKKIFDPAKFVGADLMRFTDGNSPAVPESIAGVGNNASYGIRTMIGDEDGLFLGMANPMNLLTCLDDQKSINNGPGGWSLICLRSSAHLVTTVPTLGEWGIVILALLILISSLVAYHKSIYTEQRRKPF